MAQLPPKIPTMTPSWSPFSHHHHHHHHKTPSMNAASPHPSWVDEFLDFSSVRRSAHRRSASDSAAFPDERGGDCPSSFDDGQLASMFSDENAADSNPCTPSDHDSANETRVKNDGAGAGAGEVESSCKYEALPPPPPPASSENGSGSSLDPKRVKRILANRQSAQRSRVRKLQYISELERSVTSLQTEVSTLSPRVAYLDHQRLVLNVDNSALKQRIAALAQDKIFKDAHQEALKHELERLRQVYHQQNLKNMSDPDNAPIAASIDNADEQQDQN